MKLFDVKLFLSMVPFLNRLYVGVIVSRADLTSIYQRGCRFSRGGHYKGDPCYRDPPY